MKPKYSNEDGCLFAKVSIPFFVNKQHIENAIAQLLFDQKKVSRKSIVIQIRQRFKKFGNQINENLHIPFEQIEKSEILSKQIYPEFYD